MPNYLAYIAILGWPFIAYIILRRNSTSMGIFISITTAFLLLPFHFSIDPPLLPPLDKVTISSLSVLFGLFILRKKIRLFQPGLILNVFIGYLIIVIASCLLNDSSVMIGGMFLPGITAYDTLSSVIRIVLWLVPFFLGRSYLSNIKENEDIFKMLVILALIYSIPMLYEIRMSPQLHNLVYGYYPTDFIQSIRGDGYRASVFIGHGLPLAFWISIATLAAMALHKNKVEFLRVPTLITILALVFVLILSKTWSALFNISLGAIFIYKFTPSKQVTLSLVLASLVLFYPVSKIVGVFPDKEILSTIAEYNVERADSMETRYINEDMLLTHTLKKPFFGWAGFGRNRLYNEQGKDFTVTDGMWILQLGIYGAFGFTFYYLFLLIPIFYSVKYIKYIESQKDRTYFALLSIMLAIGIIDSVPNTGMDTMNWLLAGALIGQAEYLKKHRQQLIKEKAAHKLGVKAT